uniref:Uncharacterized protein n=1 Tax=Branchiostoma floridae TaxID=7739 RepID=C3YQT9_BRAFL|eukprot:XP_002601433.1 hypothetical protein BRAFLDRAFT_81308 [Branchiostoma floridae]
MKHRQVTAKSAGLLQWEITDASQAAGKTARSGAAIFHGTCTHRDCKLRDGDELHLARGCFVGDYWLRVLWNSGLTKTLPLVRYPPDNSISYRGGVMHSRTFCACQATVITAVPVVQRGLAGERQNISTFAALIPSGKWGKLMLQLATNPIVIIDEALRTHPAVI